MSLLMSAPELRVCGDDYKVTGVAIDAYTSFEYVERYRGRHSWTLEIDASNHQAQYFTAGRIIHYYVPDTDKIIPLIVKRPSISDGVLTVTGNDYLGDRAEYTILRYGTTTGNGTDSIVDAADTVIRHLIDANIISATDPQNRDPFMRLETQVEPIRGGTATIDSRYQTLLEQLESASTQGGVGWEAVVIDDETLEWGWGIEIRLRLGTDRTEDNTGDIAPIILSEESGTAKLKSFDDFIGPTVAIVAGAGEGAARLQVIVGDLSATGKDRREIFVDAGSESDVDTLTQKGLEALETSDSTSIEAEYLPSGSYTYGADFGIGDTITIDMGDYGAYDLPIVVVSRTWTATETTIDLTLGTELKDVVRMIRDVKRTIPAIRA